MFLQHFGLSEQPFGVTPNPRYLYHSSQHREALASLIYGIEADTGFAALIAPPGLGKTTLLFYLLENFRATARTALIFQTQCTSTEFLRYIAGEFDLDSNSNDPVVLNDRIRDVLVQEAHAGRRAIIIVDEAQNLSDDVLETVRLLSDFETPDKKLLHIILAGQPQLAEKLAKPALAQLLQRIAMLNRLNPLPADEIRNYIDYRLSVAGYRGPSLFTPQAVAAIASLSGGVPRKINRICFNALSLACAVKKRMVDGEVLREVSSDLDIGELLYDKGVIGVPEELDEMMYRPRTHGAFQQAAPEASVRPAVVEKEPERVAVPVTANSAPVRPITWIGNTVAVANAAIIKSEAATPVVSAPKPAPSLVKPSSVETTAPESSPVNKHKTHKLPVILIFCLFLLGGGGWAVWQGTSQRSDREQQPATVQPQETAGDSGQVLELPASTRTGSTAEPSAGKLTSAQRAPEVARRRRPAPYDIEIADQVRYPARQSSNTTTPSAPMKVAGNQALVDIGAQSGAKAPAQPSAPSEASAGTLLHRVDPIYPARAIAAGIDGTVVLNAVIAKDGRLKSIRPVQGNWLLAEAAMDAAKKWVYRPYIVSGQPVEVETVIQVKFQLPK